MTDTTGNENPIDASSIEELRAWKKAALQVMPDFQAIGNALGLTIGQDVSPRILPGILKLKERIAELENEITNIYEQQAGESL